MDDALKKDIENAVAAIFSEKEQAGQMQATQDALNESAETIESLTQTLESTQTELAAAKESANEEMAVKDSKISEITTELEAAQKKVEEVEAELAASKESLDNMVKDQQTEARMVELKEAKVAMGNNLESQTAKVREMNDEEFASYKAERVELRDAVKKEIEAAAAQAAAAAEDNSTEGEEGTETAEEGTVNTETASTEEDTTTPPANIAPGQAIAAAMNFENKPSEDMVNKYRDMGKAMADILSPKTEKK